MKKHIVEVGPGILFVKELQIAGIDLATYRTILRHSLRQQPDHLNRR